MSRKYKIKNQANPHFVSFAVIHWIDLFTRQVYFEIMLNSLKYCQENKGLALYAYCIMPSHIHLIINSKTMLQQDLLRDLKRHTSKELISAISENIQESRKEWMLKAFAKAGQKNANNSEYQFWQQNNQPIEMFDQLILIQKLNYIHNNPVVSGFVERAEYYKYSSASNYINGNGLIDIEEIA